MALIWVVCTTLCCADLQAMGSRRALLLAATVRITAGQVLSRASTQFEAICKMALNCPSIFH